MSQRPAYNLINQLSKLSITKDEAKELSNDFDQVKASLTLGLNSIGELMAIATSEDNEAGVSTNTLVCASWLITSLSDLIQGCNEQENDYDKYINGESSFIGNNLTK